MSINHEEFLLASEKIIQNPKSIEVDLRIAVGRAYYAAYHACLDSIPLHQHSGVGAHETLIRSMLDHNDEKIRALGLQLRKCKVKRTKADYKLSQNILIGEANQVFDECKIIRDSIDNLNL